MFNPRFFLNLLYWLSTDSLALQSNRAFNSNMNWFRIHSKLWLGHTNDESFPKLKTDTNDIRDPLFIWISFTHVLFCLEIYWKCTSLCGQVNVKRKCKCKVKCFIFFRCSPKCSAITGGDAVIGKRSFDGKIGNEDRTVLVSAGPFYLN